MPAWGHELQKHALKFITVFCKLYIKVAFIIIALAEKSSNAVLIDYFYWSVMCEIIEFL